MPDLGGGGQEWRRREGEGRRGSGRKRQRGTQDPADLNLKWRPGWRREAGRTTSTPMERGQARGAPMALPAQPGLRLPLEPQLSEVHPYPQGTRRPGQRPWAQCPVESKESRKVAASDTVHSEPGLTVPCTPLLSLSRKGNSPA